MAPANDNDYTIPPIYSSNISDVRQAEGIKQFFHYDRGVCYRGTTEVPRSLVGLPDFKSGVGG